MKFKNKTIFKNPKAHTWYTRIRNNGKQIYISGKTQKEVLNKLKSQLNYSTIKKNILSLQNWFNEWLNLYKIKKVSQETIRDYEKSLKHIPKNILDKDIKLITLENITILLNVIEKDRAKQKVYELLKALFDKAFIHEKIIKNPFKFIDKPKYEKGKGIALNLSEQKTFIKACENNIYGNVYLFTLFQGLRIGEVLAITKNDINLINKTLNINKALKQNGKIENTKNKQSIRIMPLFQPSINLLTKLNIKTEYIFNFNYTTIQKNIKSVLKGTNLPIISMHNLRHTFITNCKNENIPEHIIQSWCGHEIGSKVTSTVYTHLTEDSNKTNINKLNNSKYYSNTTQ